MKHSIIRSTTQGGSPLRRIAAAMASVCLVALMAPQGSIVPAAQAQQVQISAEFRTALGPHGKWQRSRDHGEVWIPAQRERNWRPYTVGRWVYTDDYGWYWVAAEREAPWGWVTYHYGRWVLDAELGWVWTPGNEWGPAWVSWRRGGDHIGWAPLPPERVLVEYRDRPDVWIFVRGRDFVAPNLFTIVLRDRPDYYIRETVIVNRTVVVGGGGFAVNPGIVPAVVAAISGQPLRTYDVRPRVLVGLGSVPNAVEVRADVAVKNARETRATLQESKETIAAEKTVPKPEPLAANENGRLGERPPTAARQAAQPPQGGTTDAAKDAATKNAAPGATKDAATTDGSKEAPSGTPQQKQGAPAKEQTDQRKDADDARSKSAAPSKVIDKDASRPSENTEQPKPGTPSKSAAPAKGPRPESKGAAPADATPPAKSAAPSRTPDRASPPPAAQRRDAPTPADARRAPTRPPATVGRGDSPSQVQGRGAASPSGTPEIRRAPPPGTGEAKGAGKKEERD